MNRMSLRKEIEDSLQACREIEEQLAQGDTKWKKAAARQPEGFRPEAGQLDEILSLYQKSGENTTVPESDVEKTDKIQETTVLPETAEVSEQEELPETEEIGNSAQHPLLRTLLGIVICIFTALVLALIITRYVAHHTSVEGSSMETTLSNGDQIIVENISYYIHDPERFDVVVFPNKEGVNYIKRIIGLPGETVQIADGYIYIDGEALLENYGNELMEDPGLAAEEISLGEDEYFVLGDNRNASIDSRRDEVGTVKRDSIRGKAWFRFYPFSKAGSIK